MSVKKNTVLDLFCGCGGLYYGFIEAGFEVVLGIDYWKDAITTFENNHKDAIGLVADLFNETPKQISQKTGIKKVDIIVGGPPCQGFSIAGKRIVDDERNQLYKSFVNFVDFYNPKIFLLENVPNIVSMGKGIVKDNIIEDFENLGYKVVYEVLMASDFGVPQNRKRAFFVGIKGNEEFVFPTRNTENLITAKEAISDLPENTITNGEKYAENPKSEYQNLIRKNFYKFVTKYDKRNNTNMVSVFPELKNFFESLAGL